jgi:organic hydroperoxide reductase OsmC/OhrA
MPEPRPKRFEYAVEIRDGRGLTAGAAPLEIPLRWSPEHLVLAGLIRCTLTSLAYHARRLGAEATGGGSASGVITKREEDERYAFVELECVLDARIEPIPEPDGLRELLAKAERDCFIGASLRVAPAYRWRVNGGDVAPD